MANSVSFALSDFVLNHLVCDCCQKYLSVTPVKVYPNRKVKCGRCSTSSKEEEIGAESLYNKIAEKSLFKCVNRFEGCMQLLRSSEVIEHELTCSSKKYTCPICFEEIFSYLMISHFKLNHAKSLLDTPSFMVNDYMNLRQHYLYQLDNYLFFVSLSDVGDSIGDNSRKFSLNLSPFGDGSLVKSFKANFIHFDKDNNNQCFSKCIDYPMTCSVELNVTSNSTLAVIFCVKIVEPNGGIKHITQNNIKHEEEDLNSTKNSSTSNKNNLKLYENSDLPNIHKNIKNVFGNSLKILCSKQRNILVNEAFKESVSDFSIAEGATITFTKSDKKYTVTFACRDCSLIYPCFFKSDESKVYFTGDNQYYLLCFDCYHSQTSQKGQQILTKSDLNNILFFCIWDCCEYFQYGQLYEHERSCEKQILQKCPVKSCFYYSKLFELRSHFEEQHSAIVSEQFKYNNHRISKINLKISREPIEHILLLWCICVHLKFEWKQPLWKVTVSHEIPDAEIKAVIRDVKQELICSITTSGSFRHYDKIEVYLYFETSKLSFS